jgi:hypothetical protein
VSRRRGEPINNEVKNSVSLSGLNLPNDQCLGVAREDRTPDRCRLRSDAGKISTMSFSDRHRRSGPVAHPIRKVVLPAAVVTKMLPESAYGKIHFPRGGSPRSRRRSRRSPTGTRARRSRPRSAGSLGTFSRGPRLRTPREPHHQASLRGWGGSREDQSPIGSMRNSRTSGSLDRWRESASAFRRSRVLMTIPYSKNLPPSLRW